MEFVWSRIEVCLLLIACLPSNANNKMLVGSFRTSFWTVLAFSFQIAVAMCSFWYRGLITKYWTSYTQVLETIIRFVFICTIPDFIASWRTFKNMMDYVEEWSVFEEQFKSVTGNKVPSISPCIVKCLLTYFALWTVFGTFTKQFISDDHIIIWLAMPVMFSMYYSLVISSFWAFNCIYILQISKSMNQHLTKAFVTRPNADTVRAYRILWLSQQRIIVHLSHAFGASLRVQLFIHYVGLTFNVYSLLKGIARGITSTTLRLLSSWLWNCITLASLVESSNALTVQVGRNTVLAVLSRRTHPMSIDVKNEIAFLVDTICGNALPPLLDGCIELDRKFIVKILTTTITHIIVLTQFDSSAIEALSTLQSAD